MALQQRRPQANPLQCMSYRVLLSETRRSAYSHRSLCSLSRDIDGIKPLCQKQFDTEVEKHITLRNSNNKTVVVTENRSHLPKTKQKQLCGSTDLRLDNYGTQHHNVKGVSCSRSLIKSENSSHHRHQKKAFEACDHSGTSSCKPEKITRPKFTHHSSLNRAGIPISAQTSWSKTVVLPEKEPINAVIQYNKTIDSQRNIEISREENCQYTTTTTINNPFQKVSALSNSNLPNTPKTFISQVQKKQFVPNDPERKLNMQSTITENDIMSIYNYSLKHSGNRSSRIRSLSRTNYKDPTRVNIDTHIQCLDFNQLRTTPIETSLHRQEENVPLRKTEDKKTIIKSNRNLIFTNSFAKLPAILTDRVTPETHKNKINSFSLSRNETLNTSIGKSSLPTSNLTKLTRNSAHLTNLREYDSTADTRDFILSTNDATTTKSIRRGSNNKSRNQGGSDYQDLCRNVARSQNRDQNQNLDSKQNHNSNQELNQSLIQNKNQHGQDQIQSQTQVKIQNRMCSRHSLKADQDTDSEDSPIENLMCSINKNFVDIPSNAVLKGNRLTSRKSFFTSRNTTSRICSHEKENEKGKVMHTNCSKPDNTEHDHFNEIKFIKLYKEKKHYDSEISSFDSIGDKPTPSHLTLEQQEQKLVVESKDYYSKNFIKDTRSSKGGRNRERCTMNYNSNECYQAPIRRNTCLQKHSTSIETNPKHVKTQVATETIENGTLPVQVQKGYSPFTSLKRKSIRTAISQRLLSRSSNLGSRSIEASASDELSRIVYSQDKKFSRSQTEQMFIEFNRQNSGLVQPEKQSQKTKTHRQISNEIVTPVALNRKSFNINSEVSSLRENKPVQHNLRSELPISTNGCNIIINNSTLIRCKEHCASESNKNPTNTKAEFNSERPNDSHFCQLENSTPLNVCRNHGNENRKINNSTLTSFSPAKSIASGTYSRTYFCDFGSPENVLGTEVSQCAFPTSNKISNLPYNQDSVPQSVLKSEIPPQSIHQQIMIDGINSEKTNKIKYIDGKRRANSMMRSRAIDLTGGTELSPGLNTVSHPMRVASNCRDNRYRIKDLSSHQEGSPCYVFYSPNQSTACQKHNTKFETISYPNTVYRPLYRRASRSVSPQSYTNRKIMLKTPTPSYCPDYYVEDKEKQRVIEHENQTKDYGSILDLTIRTPQIVNLTERSLDNCKTRYVNQKICTIPDSSNVNSPICQTVATTDCVNMKQSSQNGQSCLKRPGIEIICDKLNEVSERYAKNSAAAQQNGVFYQGKVVTKEVASTTGHEKTSGNLQVKLVNSTLFPKDTTNVRYHIIQILQQAMFGAVYVAAEERLVQTDNSTEWEHQKLVAIKMVAQQLVSTHKGETPEDILAEIKFYEAMCGHKNVISYDLFWEEGDKIFMVMPWAELGDLFDALSKRAEPLSEPQARWLFKQVLEGAYFLHQKCIAFRDHSLENVLLFYNKTDESAANVDTKDPIVLPKITDPGQAIYFSIDPTTNTVEKKNATTMFGKSFRPPEVYLKRPYDPTKVDSFCLGWMLYFVLTKKQAFNRAIFSDFNWSLICQGQHTEFFDKTNTSFLSKPVRSLLCKMLDPDPNSRYSIEDCLKHSWFKEFNEPVTVSSFLQNSEKNKSC